MLKHRLPTGAALIALAILLGWLDQWIESRWSIRGLALGVVAAPVLMIGAAELAAMLRAIGVRLASGLAPASALCGFAIGATAALSPPSMSPFSFVVPLVALWLAVTLVAVSWPKRTEGALMGAAAAILTLVYLGLIPSFFLALRQHTTAWTLMALILIVKSCDMGAYFTGMSIGRRKLIPWLSPGKTWEGLAGGVAASAGVAALLAWLSSFPGIGGWLGFPLDPVRALALGAGLALVGQFGDLTVSLFKRDSGLKDASSRLPGLGGVLDVIDSLIFAAPVAHWLILGLN